MTFRCSVFRNINEHNVCSSRTIRNKWRRIRNWDADSLSSEANALLLFIIINWISCYVTVHITWLNELMSLCVVCASCLHLYFTNVDIAIACDSLIKHERTELMLGWGVGLGGGGTTVCDSSLKLCQKVTPRHFCVSSCCCCFTALCLVTWAAAVGVVTAFLESVALSDWQWCF